MDKIKNICINHFGSTYSRIEQLPQSGSDRKYYRLYFDNKTIIAVYNPSTEENNAFVGFARHFYSLGLPVPEIYLYSPTDKIYFQQDLGNTTLFGMLQNKIVENGLDSEDMSLYRKIFDKLILFQTIGINRLDTSLCYPAKYFDGRAMMWDLNYFKYMYLKLLAIPFNESDLEDDFSTLVNYLLGAGQESFLYRDFQSANIMIVDGDPWFIDFQGGRLGAPQYDPASLLFDAKIPMCQNDRENLLDYYVDQYCKVTDSNPITIKAYFHGFSLIRVMQACGAFGFRGLYENKPSFKECVIPGGRLLQQIISNITQYVHIPELEKTIKNMNLDNN